MQNVITIGKNLYYVGASDRRLALFESVYPVERGVSYNSYLIGDEKTVLLDTCDRAVSGQFFENVEAALGGRKLDYLIIQHMEPDHSANISGILSRYPEAVPVVNAKSLAMLQNFTGEEYERALVVKDGDTLSTGSRLLRFLFAPMVHWPEVMFTYDESTGTLFSADAFGSFGAMPGSIFADEVQFEEEYSEDARRYYFNIVGKYGAQVQSVLKKAAGLNIGTVCPLHGPVWRKGFSEYLKRYDLWSRYEPEERGVAIFYASVYGHTANAAELLAARLSESGAPVKTYDVSVTDCSYLLAEAFRYSHCVFLSTTYNNGIFVNMERFLRELETHNFQNRAFSLVENGSWAPQAKKLMREKLSALRNMREIGEGVTLLSALNGETERAVCALADEISCDLKKEESL